MNKEMKEMKFKDLVYGDKILLIIYWKYIRVCIFIMIINF